METPETLEAASITKIKKTQVTESMIMVDQVKLQNGTCSRVLQGETISGPEIKLTILSLLK